MAKAATTVATTKAAKKASPIDEAIKLLEKSQFSKVIVYMTGDRPTDGLPLDMTTKVGSDVLPLFSEILESLQVTKKITLVIYTNGGLIDVPWPLVNLIRDYCSQFEVIVLKRALSAGTLISLGADRIIMPKGSFLSPVDPATSLQEGTNVKHIEIENILGYIDFAKEKVGINDQVVLGEVLKELGKEINPSFLGSINRTHALVRSLSKKLIGLHVKKMPDHQAKVLIEHLTQNLFSHTHLINRREAKQIGFDNLIEVPKQDVEDALKMLFDHYSQDMKLREPLTPDMLAVKGAGKQDETTTRAVIHTLDIKYSFKNKINYDVTINPQGINNVNITSLVAKWEKE